MECIFVFHNYFLKSIVLRFFFRFSKIMKLSDFQVFTTLKERVFLALMCVCVALWPVNRGPNNK